MVPVLGNCIGEHIMANGLRRTVFFLFVCLQITGCEGKDCRHASAQCASGFQCTQAKAGTYECTAKSVKRKVAAKSPKATASNNWIKKIRARLGTGPHLIAYDGKTHAIRNLSGRTFSLPTHVGVAMPDLNLDAVWYRVVDAECGGAATCDHRLAVLDLRGDKGPKTLLKNLPRLPSLTHLAGSRDPRGGQFGGEVLIDLRKPKKPLTFLMGLTERIEGDPNALPDADDGAARLKGVQWTDRATLTRMGKRLAEGPPKSICSVPEAKGRLKSVSQDNCEAADLCGSADNIPWSSLQIVITGHSCGDACYTDACLYNPKTKKFVNPSNPRETMATPGPKCQVDSFSIVKGGQYWIHGEKIVAADGSKVMARGKGQCFTESCRLK